MNHTPVLLEEVMTALKPQPNGLYIDATVGDGGHSQAILEHSKPSGRVLAADQDPRQLKIAHQRLKPYTNRVCWAASSFIRLAQVARAQGFSQVDGVLFDLGVSSRQLTDRRYGLSFTDDTAPLDMRLSPDLVDTAADFLNQANEVDIATVFYRYGNRHNSRQLARRVMGYRRRQALATAGDVKQALQVWNPAALAPLWMALRIWVNREEAALMSVLPQAVQLLRAGGTLAIITFHSGEDRIVKQFFKNQADLKSQPIVRPTWEEIKRNNRARSATLRIATKL